ncbi:MAG TPA: FG-GAP-like repeat-containing protein, partial [Pyrinomonadaceae bacterium]|nr:FG-GAP-like repeat-containing protein [Pyrinomonadaceae bacterium]
MKNIRITVLLAALCAFIGCRTTTDLPSKSSPQYNEIVRTFYIGLAALEVGHDVQADAKLSQLTQLAPSEPAGWSNWGLLALRQRNSDIASERLHRARDLSPDNSDIHYLLGLLESSRGNNAEAINALRKAVELDHRNLIATYKLAEEVERQGGDDAPANVEQLMLNILAAQPDNLAALVEMSRILAKRGQAERLKLNLEKIVARSSAWPQEIKDRVTAVMDAANSGDLSAAATRTAFLKNVLVQLPEYRQSLALIKPPPGEEAVPFTHFLKLETPVFETALPDLSTAFRAESLIPAADKTDWIGAISLNGQGAPVICTATAREVRLASGASFPFPAGATNTPPTINSILPLDFNYDFKTDVVLAGEGGVRLLRQDSPSAFTDVTSETKLPPGILNGKYTGAWKADIEADGDLDIILGLTEGTPIVLRNNGDGTFTNTQPFAAVSGLTDFAWADLDGDGDPDASLIDGEAKLHVFTNERQGQFTERSVPIGSSVRAIGVLDLNNDGVLDLAVVQDDGSITRLSDKDHGAGWETAEVIKVNNAPALSVLRVADLDNNGGLDLVLSESTNTLILLNDGKGKF